MTGKLKLVKKIISNVDNLSAREEKRYQLILQIRSFLREGCSHREIARRLGISTKTIRKFKEGDPKKLCQSGINQSKLDVYREEIYKCLADGYSKSRTVKYLFLLGYDGVKSTAFDYLVKIANITGRYFAPQPYVRTHTEAMKYKSGSKGKKQITLQEVVYSVIFGWMRTF